MVQLSFMIVLVVKLAAVQSAFLRHTEDTCACRNWKQAYKSGAVKCGAGAEWDWEASDPSKPLAKQYEIYYNDSTKEVVCEKFWKLLDNDRCINHNVGSDEATWCYVNAKCKEIGGGSKINDEVSWKTCLPGDLKFRDYTPEELYKFSNEHDIWFGGFAKIAYPGSKAGEMQLAQVDEFKDGIPTWVGVKINKLGLNNKPYWFDANKDGTMPFMITFGKKVYKVGLGNARDPKHPRTWTTLNCTIGC